MARLPDPKATRRAAIYCRVSTSRQEEDGSSLDTQEQRCREHAGHLGLAVAEAHVYRETHSGADLHERPKLSALRAAVRRGDVEAVVCFAVDRLSRNQAHVYILADELEHAGCALELVTESFEDSAVGKFLRSAKAFAAEVEREKTKERTLRGKKARAESGRIHNHGGDLYGYHRDRATGKRVLVAAEAAIVRRVYEWVALEGVPIRAVITRLNTQAVPPPSAGKRTYAEGRPAPRWGKGAVQRLLDDPAYKGETYAWRWKRTGKNGARELRPEDEWVKLPADVTPPIVEPDLWSAAHERRAVNHGEATRNAATPYLLRGLAYCAVCGRKMRASPEHGRRTYRCSSRESPSGPCGGSRVPADLLEEWTWEHVAAVLRDPDLIAEQVRRQREEGGRSVTHAELEAARRSLAKIEKQQERLVRRYREADEVSFPWELVEREIARAEKEKAEVVATIAAIEQRVAAESAAVGQIEALHTYCARVSGKLHGAGFDRKRQALEALAVRVNTSGRDPAAWAIDGAVTIATDAGVAHTTS